MSILTLNIGSSSIKCAAYDEQLETIDVQDFQKIPVKALFDQLSHLKLRAVGHRVVHGGDLFTKPTLIDKNRLAQLKTLIPLSPLHLPEEIAVIEEIHQTHPDLKQVACFDTAFHTKMPELHRHFPIPQRLFDAGVKRFGFHGLSYEYILSVLKEEAKDKRLIIAHLGSGASLAAIFDKKPIDTTMGLTPLGGLMMASRSGDLDPGVVTYLMREKKLTADQIDHLLNQDSGVKGISEMTNDMRLLLRHRRENPKADAAISLFCYIAKKSIGALTASLGGIDLLVFTGGIGENSQAIREEILEGLNYLNIHDVRVINTDENLMIARHTKKLIK